MVKVKHKNPINGCVVRRCNSSEKICSYVPTVEKGGIEWLRLIRRLDLKKFLNKTRMHVCHSHFSEQMFGTSGKKITSSAIPDRNLVDENDHDDDDDYADDPYWFNSVAKRLKLDDCGPNSELVLKLTVESVDLLALNQGIYDFLRTHGCCQYCCMRFLNERNSNYLLATKETLLQLKINDGPHCSTTCIACLGLFDRVDLNILLNNMEAHLNFEQYGCKTIFTTISLPLSLYVRQISIWFALFQMYPQRFSSDKLSYFSPKDAFKLILKNEIRQYEKKLYKRNSKSLVVNLLFRYEDDAHELDSISNLYPIIQRTNPSLPETFSTKFLTESNLKKYFSPHNYDIAEIQKHLLLPAAIPQQSIQPVRVTLQGPMIYVAGRYQKLSRELCHSPWIQHGDRVTKSSVEEIILKRLGFHFKIDAHHHQMSFSSIGREDRRVRCLGRGRPFYFKLHDVKRLTISRDVICTPARINLSHLQILDKNQLNSLKYGKGAAIYQYQAFCTLKYPVTIDVMEKLRISRRLTIQQKTPIAELHRKPICTNRRNIFNVSPFVIKGNPWKLVLNIAAEPAVHIEEFIFGEFGRTQPSLASIIGQEITVENVDIIDVGLDWPNRLSISQLIYNYLRMYGCCNICCLRFLNVPDDDYVNVNETLKKQRIVVNDGIMDNAESRIQWKVQKPNPCIACFGLLEKPFLNSVLNRIFNCKNINKYKCETACITLSLPISLSLRQLAIRVGLLKTFPDNFCLKEPPNITIKETMKVILNRLIENRNGMLSATKKSEQNLDSLIINITFVHDDEEMELKCLADVNPTLINERLSSLGKFHNEFMTRSAFEKHFTIDQIDMNRFCKYVPVPANIPSKPIEIIRIKLQGPTIFLGGRYQKVIRHVNHSPPWIGGDSRNGTSVQQIIIDQIVSHFGIDVSQASFSSCGNEITDSRYFGDQGRLFYLELRNVKNDQLPHHVARIIEGAVGLTSQVYLSNLKIISRDIVKHIKMCRESNRKYYRALCKLQEPVTESLMTQLNIFPPLKIYQKTPIRLLHCEPLTVRERTIYNIRGYTIEGRRKQVILDIETESGTYIKEFIHGDFGRTKPSIAELIDQWITIINLDITKIESNWPSDL